MDLRGMRVFGSAGIKHLIANNSKALEDYVLRGFFLMQISVARYRPAPTDQPGSSVAFLQRTVLLDLPLPGL